MAVVLQAVGERAPEVTSSARDKNAHKHCARLYARNVKRVSALLKIYFFASVPTSLPTVTKSPMMQG